MRLLLILAVSVSSASTYTTSSPKAAAGNDDLAVLRSRTLTALLPTTNSLNAAVAAANEALATMLPNGSWLVLPPPTLPPLQALLSSLLPAPSLLYSHPNQLSTRGMCLRNTCAVQTNTRCHGCDCHHCHCHCHCQA